MKQQIVGLLLITLAACTDIPNATKALKQSGYKPIYVGGYGWLNGSHGDLYLTNFTAIAPNGDTVSGCVSKGIFKGSTIRLNN